MAKNIHLYYMMSNKEKLIRNFVALGIILVTTHKLSKLIGHKWWWQLGSSASVNNNSIQINFCEATRIVLYMFTFSIEHTVIMYAHCTLYIVHYTVSECIMYSLYTVQCNVAFSDVSSHRITYSRNMRVYMPNMLYTMQYTIQYTIQYIIWYTVQYTVQYIIRYTI